jgi:hypothetical protein
VLLSFPSNKSESKAYEAVPSKDPVNEPVNEPVLYDELKFLKLPDNKDVLFYNDGDAPKSLTYPMNPDTLSPKPNKNYGSIYYTDYDTMKRGNKGELVQTIQL